jgi:phosphate transport system permease protein
LLAQGEPSLWLTGGAMCVCLALVVSLLLFILYQGTATFWPREVVQLRTLPGQVYLGEVTRHNVYQPADSDFEALPAGERERIKKEIAKEGGKGRRRLLRTGNFDLTNTHFHWVNTFAVSQERTPPWAFVLERRKWGNFYGFPVAFRIKEQVVASTPEDIWARFQKYHPLVLDNYEKRVKLERDDIGLVNVKQDDALLDIKRAALRHGVDSSEYQEAQRRYEEVKAWVGQETTRIQKQIDAINEENDKYVLSMRTSLDAAAVHGEVISLVGLGDSPAGFGPLLAASTLYPGRDSEIVDLPLAIIVRGYPANQLTFWDKIGVYLSRWREFLFGQPREANTEGGVAPQIWGTVALTLIMCICVVPFGVLAAVYLREYAKAGPIVSAVRIAVNNLAGVPSIVFGVFGLGFLCYVVGGEIDTLFFPARLPNPTFGSGGVIWASVTLALLTLPVVIVSTEEALAAVPSSMREGSYACGASKWQTIWRIVLPRAMPGIMTGTILAMARGAGEVAPIMLVGCLKFIKEVPYDLGKIFTQNSFLIRPEKWNPSFTALGFHIYDVGFQSPNSEAAKPMAYTTTLLLIVIIAVLNLMAIWLRSRFRKRFATGQF